MIDEVLETIKKYNMFEKGDKVVVAVSGGPDSICLLHVLYNLKDKLGINLVAAHVNHCLRGKDADDDENYVKNFCNEFGIECYVKREDVNKIAEEKKISQELAGREVRYKFFNDVLKKVGGNKIALAHNANDQAETMLMRFFRGTGLDGLTGIKPVRDNIYVRPIINIERYKIEDYCEKNKLNPRIDKTNIERDYTRNKIRLDVIPYIKENFNPDIVECLNKLEAAVKRDNEYLSIISYKKYSEHCKKLNNKIIICAEAFKEHEAILTRIIRLALKELLGNLYNIDSKHIYDIIKVQRGSTGKEIMLPNDTMVLNNYGDIDLYLKSNQERSNNKEEYKLLVNNNNRLESIGLNITLEIIDNKGQVNLDNDMLIKYFDFDKVNGEIKLRYRKNGDRFIPLGMEGSKKLKDLFIDLKIPKNERDYIPLITFGDHIGWIVGYRISDKFKIDKNTKKILKIKVEREGNANVK